MAGLRQPGGNSPAGVSGRQMETGRPAAGSSGAGAHRASTSAHPWRLDPFSLPARFATADDTADAGLRIVDLHRERVVLRRALCGMRMAVNLPVAGNRGDQIGCCNRDATLCRGHARTRRRVAIAAAVRVDRYRRHCRRMADLGSYSRTAAVDQRHRRDDARGVRAHGALADRSADMAASAAQQDRAPAAVAVVAPARGSGRSRLPRPSRRARNHRVGIGFVF